MAMHVALLRGVNVGGRSAVPMAGLRAMLEDMGLEQPRTLLQSGNAVFGSTPRVSSSALETDLEAAAQRHFGKRIDFMLRSAAEWSTIIERNPFAAEAAHDPAHLLVMALKGRPTAAAVKALRAAYTGPESVHVDGRQVYLVYPEGIGRSKLTNVLLERTLGVAGTARNWNTVLKLAALLDA